MTVELRPTTRDDLDAQHPIFRAAIGELFGRHGFEPPEPAAEAFRDQQAHVLEHDAERCWVAVENGRLVAFAGALARGRSWFLSTLFVSPDVQARGLGRELLDRVWGSEYDRRLTMTDSIQPVSNGLYAARGLIPSTPVLTLAGRPRRAGAGDVEPGEAGPDDLARIDAAAYGFDRAPDHAYWAARATRTAWLDGGEVVAYSYRWPTGRIGPLAALDPRSAAAALTTELSRTDGATALLVPGSSRTLVATALAAGLRIVGPPGLLLASDGVRLPDSLAVSGFALF